MNSLVWKPEGKILLRRSGRASEGNIKMDLKKKLEGCGLDSCGSG
jgi:hypothetical protein